MSTDGMNPRTPGDRAGRSGERPAERGEEPESLAQLRGDCARMPDHWRSHGTAESFVHSRPGGHVQPARLHGVHVPERSAHLLDGMSDYGD